MHITPQAMLKSLVAGLLLVSVQACQKVNVEEIPVTANPSDEITKLEGERDAAFAQQINVLAPRAYHKAADSLREAKEDRDSGKDSKEILASVAEGRAHLKQARATSEISKSTLGDVVQARADAVAAGAPKLMEHEFEAIDKVLVQSTEEIEDNDLGTAESNKSKLKKDYNTVEVRAIKKEKLSGAAYTIENAEKEGAKETATRTLTDAKKAHGDAEKFIENNPKDKAGIQAHADAATASANRLLTITRQVKVVDKKDGEALYLETEAQQKKLAEEQAVVAAKEVALAGKQAELANSQAATAAVTGEKDKLAAEQAFQQRLELAKAQFSPSEAEVYRDGNRLVIRMKSLAFQTGKSHLSTSNYPLLAKVQKVIRDLGPSRIVVEGHTDSVGKKAANQKLSEDRAAAIKGYLVANGVPDPSLSAAGFGDTRPITENKTKDGRAQNRRVDVIVEPIVEPTTH